MKHAQIALPMDAIFHQEEEPKRHPQLLTEVLEEERRQEQLQRELLEELWEKQRTLEAQYHAYYRLWIK